MSRAQTAVLLQDVVRFYSYVRQEHLASLEAFDALWADQKLEWMHYAGSTAVTPYLTHVVGHLIGIGVAYLCIPYTASEKASRFGWMLLYFFYMTQPGIDDPTYRVRVRVPLATMRLALDRCADDPVLFDIIAQLQTMNAFHVVPFVDNLVVTQEILRVHEEQSVPLIFADDIHRMHGNAQDDDDVPLSPTLAAELAEYDLLVANLTQV